MGGGRESWGERANPEGEMVANWLQLIRAEYMENPGLCLTRREAERLWGLEPLVCESLLAALVDANFPKRNRRDQYVRSEASI